MGSGAAITDGAARLNLTGDPAARFGINGGHVAALDGIRGIAILMVLVFHFAGGLAPLGYEHNIIMKATRGGWAGVDLFFVLSGFLITGILYDSRQHPKFFKNFYIRRTLRIFPLYFAALLIAFLATSLWAPLQSTNREGFGWAVLFLTNLAVAANGWQAVPEIAAHYWSLAVEEQFYLVWPFVVYLAGRRTLMAIAIAIILGAFLLRVALVQGGADPATVYAFTLTRADCLAMGGLCALLLRSNIDINRIRATAAPAAALCAALLAILLISRGTFSEYDPVIQQYGFSLLALGFGALVLASVTWAPLSAVMSAPVLRWFGRYSYGLYVWHYLVFIVFFDTGGLVAALDVQAYGRIGAVLYIGAAALLSLAIAWLSYHLAEKHFIRMKDRFSTTPKAAQG